MGKPFSEDPKLHLRPPGSSPAAFVMVTLPCRVIVANTRTTTIVVIGMTVTAICFVIIIFIILAAVVKTGMIV